MANNLAVPHQHSMLMGGTAVAAAFCRLFAVHQLHGLIGLKACNSAEAAVVFVLCCADRADRQPGIVVTAAQAMT